MEIHYDTLHLQRHLALGKGQKKRSSEYKVFTTVAQSYRLKLCQRIELPDSIKSIFRRPADEDDWGKLEEARLAIARCILGEKALEIELESEASELVSALERSSSVHPDELVGHDMFPDGSRVVVEAPPSDLSVAQQRAMVCDAVAKSVGRTLSIRTRPLSMNPPLDRFAKAIVDPSLIHPRSILDASSIHTSSLSPKITKFKLNTNFWSFFFSTFKNSGKFS